MSTFYLLPPRAALADRLGDVLASLLPGLSLHQEDRARLVAFVLEALEGREDVFLVPRDELPVGETPERALLDGYGASPGDEVIEIRAARPGEFASRRWHIASSPANALG
jgi:hypothetical protein